MPGRRFPRAGALVQEERMAFTQSESIEVKRIKGKGRGVFARRLIRRGELIEKVPMLVLRVEDYYDGLGKTSLANYCFNWKEGTVALALCVTKLIDAKSAIPESLPLGRCCRR